MFDVVRFLNDYGIDWVSKGANVGRGWIGYNCPFCGDVGFHGGFYLADGHNYCWKCGGHSIFNVVKELTGKPVHEVYKIVDEYGDRTTILSQLNTPIRHSASLSLPGYPLDEMCRKYLRKRKFDPDFLEQRYSLRSGGIVGRWAFRLLIPVFHEKKLISFMGRDVTNKQEIRYKNLSLEESVMDIKTVLFNLDNCTRRKVVVVEGALDCMRWGDDCCATMGTTVTEQQIRQLSTYKKVYVMFDNDAPGKIKAQFVAEKLAVLGAEVEVVDHGMEHDLGAASEDEVNYLKKELGF
jgi:hypothetical protein